MIPRLKPRLGPSELIAALTPGAEQDVTRFEESFAAKAGQRHAVAFPYGRTGLTLLLEAMGLAEKEIICPAYTCVVVPHAIRYSGNQPVFVDSREHDFNMDLALLPHAIGDKTAAIIATSIFGYPVDLDALAAIRERYPHLLVIQDCAHSFNADWNGRPVQQFGDAAIYGLNISKMMTSVFGGMVTTDDDALAERLRRLRTQKLRKAGAWKTLRRLLYLSAIYPAFNETIYGTVNMLERSGFLDRFVRYYDEAKVDMPADWLESMTALEARVGSAQLRSYDRIVERRRYNAAFYNEHLPLREGVQLPPLIPGSTYSHYVLLAPERERIMERGLAQGVQFGRLIEYNVPRLEAYRDSRHIDAGVADRFSRCALNLPVHCTSDRQLRKVIAVYAEAMK